MSPFLSIRGVAFLLAGVALLASQHRLSAQESARLIQTIKQADPGLTWAIPPPVPFGTALDATQLDATARTAGAFVYTPAVGTIPPSGQNTLSVIFTPKDPNYLTARATVALSVTPPGSSSFNLSLGSITGKGELIMLRRGQTVVVPLFVAPIGDFHQPVTFSCGETQPSVTCVFSPQAVRPVASAVPLTLTLTLDATAKPSSSGSPFPGPRSSGASSKLSSSTLLLSFLLAGLFHWRSRSSLQRARVLGMLSLAALFAMTGCGWTGNRQERLVRQVPITGHSLVESRTIYLSYVLDDRN